MQPRGRRCKTIPEVPNVNQETDDTEEAVEEIDPGDFERTQVGYICEDCGKTWPTSTLPDDGDEVCPKCRDDN